MKVRVRSGQVKVGGGHDGLVWFRLDWGGIRVMGYRGTIQVRLRGNEDRGKVVSTSRHHK